MKIVRFTSPFANKAGRIALPWRGPPTTLAVEMEIAGLARPGATQVELWSNAGNNRDPSRYRAQPMTHTGHLDGVDRFEARLQVAAAGNYRVAGRFCLEPGGPWIWTGDQGHPDLLFRPRPPWLHDLTIEIVSVAGVNCRADGVPGTFADMMQGGSPLEGGACSLAWLADSGVNCLWLLPIFPPSPTRLVARDDDFGSPYAATCLFEVRPELAERARGLGGKAARRAALAEFRDFVAMAHDLGLRLLLDVALNHVGPQHRFADLFTTARGGYEVRYNDFSNLDLDAPERIQLALRLADPRIPDHLEQLAPWMFGSQRTFPAGASDVGAIAPGGWFEWPDALQLNHGRRRTGFRSFVDAGPTREHRAVRDWLTRALTFWAVEVGVDGFRLDHLAGMPLAWLEEAGNRVQAAVDEVDPGRTLILIGEDHDTADRTQHFLDAVQSSWLGELLADPSAARLEQIVEDPWFCHLANLATHDEDRVAGRLGGNLDAVACLTGLCLLVGGASAELCGDRLGERQRLHLRSDRPIAALCAPTTAGRELARRLSRMARLRRTEPALAGRGRTWLGVGGPSGWPETGKKELVALARHPRGQPGRSLIVVASLHPEEIAERVRLDPETLTTLAPRATYRVRDLLKPALEAAPVRNATARVELTGAELMRDGLPIRLRPWQIKVLAIEPVDRSGPALDRSGPALDESGPAPEPGTAVVRFEHRADPRQLVELAGDFNDFGNPLTMEESAPGCYSAELQLGPGVYRYKYRLNRRTWQEERAAVAIDHAEGLGNALCTVQGSPHPVQLAPDRRHLLLHPDGRLVVQLEVSGVDRPPDRLWLRWSGEPGRVEPVPLCALRCRHGQLLMRATAMLEPHALPTHLGLHPDRGPLFALPPPSPTLASAPAWAAGSVWYAIFVDRWRRGSGSPPDPRAAPREAPSSATTFYGGDLDGIREALDELVDLGVDGLVLTPVHPSPTPHRYDATNLTAVDERLGGERALRQLIDAAHQRSLRIVLDVAVTHVNEAHPAFQDLLAHQEASPYAAWFRIRRFPVSARAPETVALYPTRPELPLLELGPGPAREHALDAALALVRLGVDGLRLDAVSDAPPDFWQELRARARALNPELFLLGEIVGDRPHPFLEEGGVDSATNFTHREAMFAFLGCARIDAPEFWSRTALDRFRRGPFDPISSMLFLDNHDTGRFTSVTGYFDRLRLALAYMLFRPEPVWLTYGTELGLSSGVPEGELDNAWPERLPMPPTGAPSGETGRTLRLLLGLRRRIEPWRHGALALVTAQGHLLVLERRSGNGVVRGCFNAGDRPVRLPDLPDGVQLLAAVNHDGTNLGELPPRAASFFWTGGDPSHLQPAVDSAAPPERQERAPLDRPFRRGELATVTPPSRFHINLSDRCPLGCRHCITRAPEATRSGRGQVMGPEIVRALGPHLRNATYVGFTHAGEPLASPQLRPFLRLLEHERRGQPTVVHLLTGGHGLSPERFLELCNLGVNSWSFSMDGMSEHTHDALRLGSNVQALRATIAQLTALREARQIDARLGIAWTVTRSNLHEIESLVRFAAGTDLDWLKLEELFPINPVAAAEAKIPGPELTQAMEQAAALAGSLGVPLLDHVHPLEARRCERDRDPKLRQIGELDNFVNRLEINSCRLPWELVCVEPDGRVRPVDFHHPVAGNLVEQDLTTLFNSEGFRMARWRALERRVCTDLPLCPSDPGPASW